MTSFPYKVCITLGTRPEAIKLAPLIKKFQSSKMLNTYVILTGQHQEMVRQVMKLFNIEANEDLKIMQPDQSLTDITCRSLKGLEEIFIKIKPQCVIVQGDTTTSFAASLAAFYQKIPIGHVEAGLRTDNIYSPYPEEANRRLISQLAQLHFAPTYLALENLKHSNVTGKIYLTGNTVVDALLEVSRQFPDCNVNGLDWNQYDVLLATVHRRENWGTPLENILKSFCLILEKFPNVALLIPMHCNPIIRKPIQDTLGKHPRVFLTEPLDYTELIGAIQKCYLILTDSGGLQEEVPSLGKPLLVLRETTERPEAVEAGTSTLVGTDPYKIFMKVNELLTNKPLYSKMTNIVNPFGDGQSSSKILGIVESFLKKHNS
ncbi:MAG: UDP-N-Acetylglucosamine 2-epimerase [Candidatus Atelocyanobacterium thalassa isolate SIO64986]|uniref:UDP-N-acetylglucosamine 2-epimerase (non-hydrolyzing) n=1 Tax=Candidatus Atelocyanobacterium thalassa isolate SIO64986 TaxID=1527444 RepID=A0A086CI72_9CHRO|nr:MAG: UDP-N-Acetylglucosamine 2-epimerase [Candidatus Atelocyanobacterium thalassa isolate SIO64986]